MSSLLQKRYLPLGRDEALGTESVNSFVTTYGRAPNTDAELRVHYTERQQFKTQGLKGGGPRIARLM